MFFKFWTCLNEHYYFILFPNVLQMFFIVFRQITNVDTLQNPSTLVPKNV